MKCMLCHTEMDDWLVMPTDPKKREPTRFGTVKRCPACHFGSVFPQPTPDDVPAFYQLPSYYTHGETHFRDPNPGLFDKLLWKAAYYFDKGEHKQPGSFTEHLNNTRVLDVGSGSGGKLKKYAEFSENVFGIEPDPNALTHNSDASVTVWTGTAEDMPGEVRGRTFDFISMTHVLEHCIDPVRAVRNVTEICEPGTVFWIEVPNSECLHFKEINICSEMFDAPRHLHFFSPENLANLLTENGFEIAETYYHGFQRHHSLPWRDWEIQINDMLSEHPREITKQTDRHTIAKSLSLFLRSCLAGPEAKYDCVGFVCTYKG